MKISWRGPNCQTLKQVITHSLWELKGRTFFNAQPFELDADQIKPGLYDTFVMWSDADEEIFAIPMEPIMLGRGDKILVPRGRLQLENTSFGLGKTTVEVICGGG